MMHPIKQDYSKDIANFIKNGGKIQQAKNTSKTSWNGINDVAIANADNNAKRQYALDHGIATFETKQPCKKCDTKVRSSKSNVCLECDRRRNRNSNMTPDKLKNLAIFLLAKGSTTIEVDGKEYTLKIEENNND